MNIIMSTALQVDLCSSIEATPGLLMIVNFSEQVMLWSDQSSSSDSDDADDKLEMVIEQLDYSI